MQGSILQAISSSSSFSRTTRGQNTLREQERHEDTSSTSRKSTGSRITSTSIERLSGRSGTKTQASGTSQLGIRMARLRTSNAMLLLVVVVFLPHQTCQTFLA